MGGNVRHAAKGPDRRKSTCADCGTSFTHGKFSSRTYCDDCRDERRDPDQVTTQVDVTVDTDLQQLLVTVTIGNTNDVPVRDIPTLEPDGTNGNVIGFLRIESTNRDVFAAEVPWMEQFSYGFKLRAEQARSATFIWDGDSISQQDRPTTRSGDVLAPEFRNRVEMTRGDVFDADEITVSFTPAEQSPELTAVEESVSIPSYSVEL